MIVVSNRFFPNAIQTYRKRWGIESAPQAHEGVLNELKLCA
jgi:hypothetical protein